MMMSPSTPSPVPTTSDARYPAMAPTATHKRNVSRVIAHLQK